MIYIKKLVILVPCHNEEKGIEIVLDLLPKRFLDLYYETEIIVIDNNCTDRTAEIAESKGAKVVKELEQGKGHALLKGFKEVPADSDIVAIIDGDASYDIREIARLLEPIENDFCDVVVGSRLHGRLAQKSMTAFNRLGNWMFTFLARVGYRTNVTDVCSGFSAWKKEVIDALLSHLKSNSFSIEMEMIAKLARMNYECYSVPISYYPRNGHSSLKPLKDGFIIFFSWLKYLTWHPGEIAIKKSIFHDIESSKEKI